MKVVGAELENWLTTAKMSPLIMPLTRLEESARKAIRPRGLIASGVVDRGFNFLLRKRGIKARQVASWDRDGSPI
jgi:hypothetical protein